MCTLKCTLLHPDPPCQKGQVPKKKTLKDGQSIECCYKSTKKQNQYRVTNAILNHHVKTDMSKNRKLVKMVVLQHAVLPFQITN